MLIRVKFDDVFCLKTNRESKRYLDCYAEADKKRGLTT